MTNAVRMEKIVSLCKRRGFIFQSSEIYGGLNGFWDYGPLGAELKRHVKELWWNRMTRMRDDIAGLEATIIMHPQIWRASGHVETFADLMRECSLTNKRVRADQVDPQSGTVFKFTGITSLATEWKSERPMALLQKKGEHVDSLRKRAREYYVSMAGAAEAATGKLSELQLLGETTEVVENSIDYHPETGGALGEARPFNLMLKTYVGPTATEADVAYLRPETAQAIFAQFKNVQDTSRQKVPFGICQIGKAFRNEVTPRNFTFRSREFEQMELEFFIKPDEAIAAISGEVAGVSGTGHPGEPQPAWGWELWHKYWVEERLAFYEYIGLPRETLEEYWQTPEELAHYARATVDLLFKFPFGAQELEGIAARSDYDLSQHQRYSGKAQTVFDDELRQAWSKVAPERQKELRDRYYDARLRYMLKTGVAEPAALKLAGEDADGLAKGNYIPHVIEPSAGVDRLLLALICHAYDEEEVTDEKGNKETRVVMRFHPRVAPVKAGVFPLLRNKPELVAKAKEVRDLLRQHMNVFYDDAGAIGRRYRRQDEAGTPFGITIDFDTIGERGDELKDTVTLRSRDSMTQERVKIGDLVELLLPQVR
jgi:glycyl-tRNA synthetase